MNITSIGVSSLWECVVGMTAELIPQSEMSFSKINPWVKWLPFNTRISSPSATNCWIVSWNPESICYINWKHTAWLSISCRLCHLRVTCWVVTKQFQVISHGRGCHVTTKSLYATSQGMLPWVYMVQVYVVIGMIKGLCRRSSWYYI